MGTYCTADEVILFTGIDPATADTTRIESIIAMNEDYIDHYTGHAWRPKQAEEIHHVILHSMWGRGTPIFLNHRKIQSIDGMWMWVGNYWDDLLSRLDEGNDYSVDYEDGIIFIRGFIFYPNRKYSIKVRYTYGDTIVPGDIKKACILLTAYDLFTSEDKKLYLVSGTNVVSMADKIRQWKEDALRILDQRVEWKVGAF